MHMHSVRMQICMCKYGLRFEISKHTLRNLGTHMKPCRWGNLSIRMRTYIHFSMFKHTHRRYICACACVYVCLCVYIHRHTHVCNSINTNIRACAHKKASRLIQVHIMHMHTGFIYIYIYIYIHSNAYNVYLHKFYVWMNANTYCITWNLQHVHAFLLEQFLVQGIARIHSLCVSHLIWIFTHTHTNGSSLFMCSAQHTPKHAHTRTHTHTKIAAVCTSNCHEQQHTRSKMAAFRNRPASPPAYTGVHVNVWGYAMFIYV
jgi:hypothetical protein